MDIASLFNAFSAWSQSIAVTWGYLGIFLISLIGSATILFPVPAFFVVFASGAVLNPWLVGIAAGAGSALGELTGYGIGFAGEKAISKKHEKWLKRANEWAGKYKMFTVIVIFAATPLPDDIVGILCGVIKYDVKRFFLASLTGKLIMNVSIALGGYYGLQWVIAVFGGI